MASKDCKRLEMDSIEDYFVIGDQLGKGGFGSVFRATPTERARAEIPDLPAEGDVAIKSIVASTRTTQGIINEIMVLRALEPPRYTKYYGCFQGFRWPDGGVRTHFIDRRVYLVTNLIPGETLYQLLKSDIELTDGQRGIILSQIAEAILSLHTAGIAHLDIKPGNVMVNLDTDDNIPDVTVIDFDMTCILDKMKGSCSGLGGTPRYMDPKVKGYDKESLKRVDWWAFGLIAVELYGSIEAIPELYRDLIIAMTDPELPQSDRPDADTVAAVFGLD